MAPIAVTIIDARNQRSAHLVDTQAPIREVILAVVAQLKLPGRAAYHLYLQAGDRALPEDKTLAEMGVPAGAELHLRPERNAMLKTILDKLYDEAKGYVEDQAWEYAKQKLEELRALDPTYPDPSGLETAIAAHSGALRTASSVAPSGTRRTPARSALIGRGMTRGPAGATASPPAAGRAYELEAQGAKSTRASCLGITLTVIAVIVAGAIVLAGAVYYLPGLLDQMAVRLGIPLPGAVILGTGDVQVTLRWTGEADLDLHVIDPNGEEIAYDHPQSASGGILDVDANGDCQGVAQPVENIYWPTGRAPDGEYRVYVEYYQACGVTEPTDYTVTITVDGDVVDEIHAQITTVGEQHPVSNFTY